MKLNISKIKFLKGETLLEVMIALVVLIIGSAAATNLIITSIRSNVYNRDSLIALNLAQEGLEYMRNWRDTNWLKFSSNPEGCWNVAPGGTDCGVLNLLTETDGSDAYSLGDELIGPATDILNLSDMSVDPRDEIFEINYYDLDTSKDSDGLDRDNNGNKKDDDYDYMGSWHNTGTMSGSSKYFRTIEVDYKKVDTTSPWTSNDTSSPADANAMIVTSTVKWIDGGVVHQVKVQGALASYK